MKTGFVVAFLGVVACHAEPTPLGGGGPTMPAGDLAADEVSGGGTRPTSMQHLLCTSGRAFETFSAQLDYSGFDQASGLFDARDARIVDNYATAQLLCTGHRLAEIDCVGFWFDQGEDIVEVTTSRGNPVTAQYAPLKGNLVRMHTPPWVCTVQ
jgi:hypothetical protein